MVPRMVQHLRRNPVVGTFVSFPAEIIRTTYHILRYFKQDMKTNPGYGRRKFAGIVLAAGAIHAAQAISFALLGMGDDDEESLRDLAPEWQKNSNFLAMGYDERGNIRLLDMSFLDPYNYWKRPINATLRDQPADEAILDAGWEALKPFFGQDIAFGILMDILQNKKDSGGEVFNPEAPVPTQVRQIAAHAKKLLPGFAGNIEGISLAAEGHITASGKHKDMAEEVSALFGWRTTVLDPQTQLHYKAIDFQHRKRDAARVLSRVARDPNPVDDADLVSAYRDAVGARGDIYNQMARLVRAAINAGMDPGDVEDSLRNSGITKADAAALLDGEIPEWEPSESMMKSAIKRAEVLLDEDMAGEFERRGDVIYDAATDSR
jgi:hypothetical protein